VVALGFKSHCVARNLHCLPRTHEGRSEKRLGLIKAVDLAPDKAPQRSADRARLLAPTRVERNVELSLQAILGVVRRLAVAHEDKAMRKFRHAEIVPYRETQPAL
jgi:hypothetical protein